ncbi:SDR family oxidoreductase [Sphingomonas crocodyli]|uniref:SDR family oxidoreductase n=2 Tax=Sphingomonas crocodyli TaxID=1979270 RepID=A0A437M6R2_9SPHN|nr:SDR family oxidoreductase [Sphingomonas crocodyli]
MLDLTNRGRMNMAGRLAGRRIIVTGAASGMGRAIARLFAAEGAKLALMDIAPEPLAVIAAETGAEHLAGDVADLAYLDDCVSTFAKALGGLDGLVNAAGILRTAPIEETSPEMWDRIQAVNLFGPAQLCRIALPHLRASGKAAIVNIASLGGIRPNLTMSAYAASKGGLIAFTKVLAAEAAPDVRANALCPGFIASPMTDALYVEDPSRRDVTLARLAMNRAGTVEEIAQSALFLVSHESSFTTGAVLTSDGGSSWH